MTDLATISDDELLKSLPRGVRNRNPGNIEDGDFAKSLPGYKGSDGRFAIFDSMDNGVGAQSRLLGSYGKRGINTVEGVVNRWAPKTENDTDAYVGFVAKKLGVDPRAPLNMEDKATLEAMSDAMAEHENGVPVRAPNLSGVSDEELLASLGDQAARPKPVPTTPAQMAAAAPKRSTSQALGLAKGVAAPIDRLYDRIDATPITSKIADLTGQAFPAFGMARNLGAGAIDKLAMPAIAKAEAAGVRPGKIGEFAGNVAVSLPSGMTGMRSMFSGALTGGLMSEKDDLKGVLGDAALGGVVGRLGDAAAQGAGALVKGALSKTPKIMDMPALEGAVKAAYKRVDDSGFRLPSADLKGLVKQVSDDLREKGGPKAARLFPDADALVSRLDALAQAKGGAKLTQLDTLRSDIYDVLVKPGGKEAGIGKAMRAKIDELIDAVPNADIKGAREMYKRLSKMRTVTNKLEAADLQAGRAYTGKNVNNAIRQKLSPLIDPTSAQRIKNATPDEAKAMRKAVVGSPGQNLVRTAGSLMDPRGILGMGLQLTGAANTAGLTAASIPLGLLATATGNRMSQKNVNELLRLIAAGGSKEALKKTPTAASKVAEKVTSAARPAVTTAGAALVIQPSQKKRAK